jgi:dimethylglycine dehydrogenase
MIPALVGRISFTGELGYEIWVTSEYQRALYDLLSSAGRSHGLRLFGGRALNTMRIEKSFGTWAREYRPIYGPHEAGLGRFVDFGKGEFVGRAAALWHEGCVVGWVTSGTYGHRVQRSLALGYIPAALASATEGFEIEIIGERRRARRESAALLDPSGSRMRS